MTSGSPNLLFLSGSGLPPWVWDDTRSLLPADIQSSVMPRPAADTSLAGHAAAALAAAPDGPFTVVAHSVGAVTGLCLHDLAPDRVQGLLSIAGVVPTSGSSFVSSMPFPRNRLLPVAIRLFGTRPPDKAIRRSLGAGLAPEVADRLVDDFEPDARALFLEQATYTGMPRRRGYVITTADPELSGDLQQRFAQTLQAEWTTTIDSGHLPMIEKPAELSTAIVDFIQQPDPASTRAGDSDGG